jgi:ribonuclease P protein component
MKHTPISENHLYSKAYAKGEKCVTKSVVVYVLKDFKAKRLQNAHPLKLSVNRIGLTVTKKLGKAFVRNRVKRILRAGLRQTEKTHSLQTGYLIVIVARDICVDLKSQDIEKDLTKAFYKLGLIKEQSNEQN